MRFNSSNTAVPSDAKQVNALFYLCNQIGWKKVNILATNDAYGEGLTNSFIGFNLFAYVVRFSSAPACTHPSLSPPKFDSRKVIEFDLLIIY